jgi:hypothetical protein
MASKKQSGGGGYGGGGMPTGGGGRSKSNVVKITNKKTMGKTEAKVRVKTDKIRKSPAAEDMRKGNLDNLKKTFGKQKVTKKNNSPFGPVAAGIVKPAKAASKSPKLNAKAKTTIVVAGATANAVRIKKNKSKSEPVPRNPRKQ